MTSKNIFIDTSGFKAIADPHDDFHQKAITIWKSLQKKDSKLITSNYILDETYTLLRAKRNLSTALQFKEAIIDGLGDTIQVYRVTADDEIGAWEWFTKEWSKLSFTDCVSFALMTRLNIQFAMSFDDHFKRAGFTLVS